MTFIKKSFIASTICLALSLSSTSYANTEASTQVEETASKPSLTILPGMVSYAVGANYGVSLAETLNTIPETISIDKQELLKGFTDGLYGKETLNAEERKEILTNLNERIKETQEAEYKKLSDDNKAAGEAYRAAFAKEKGVVTTDSGLMYLITEKGSDVYPQETSIITVTYTGKFVNGEVFDEAKEMTSFPLLITIPGWQEGLPHLGLGGKMKLVIPPELGYGVDSYNLPPNSTLVFDIHLINVEADPNNPPFEE